MFAGKGVDPKVAYQRIHADLKKQFPEHILDAEDLEWMFINAGGWMAAMCPLHGSMTEYILFFGTAMDTSGHSGKGNEFLVPCVRLTCTGHVRVL